MSDQPQPAPDATPAPPPTPDATPAAPPAPDAPSAPAEEAAPEETEVPWDGTKFEYEYVGLSAADHPGVTAALNALGARGWEIAAADLAGGTFRIILMRETPDC
jgi:hypothetical protein